MIGGGWPGGFARAFLEFWPYFRTKPRERLFSLNAAGNCALKNVCRSPQAKHPIKKRLSNSKEALGIQEEFWPILKPPHTEALLETDCRFRGGLVLSYRRFVIVVGFGRSDRQWFRVNVGPNSVLVAGLLSGGPCPKRVATQIQKYQFFAKFKFLSSDQRWPYFSHGTAAYDYSP